MLGHEQHYGFFPSGGWNWEWTGDPDRGTGRDQPGCWATPSFPISSNSPSMILGLDGQPNMWTATQLAGAAIRCQTPLAVFNCPTRRSLRAVSVLAGLGGDALLR